MPAISLAGVTKVYRGAGAPVRALDAVDLEVRAGEIVGVIGPNGSGKSTLLRVVSGITGATSGSVTVSGPVASMIELGVGFHPELSVEENVAVGLAVSGLDGRRVRQAVPDVIEFAGLAAVAGDRLRTLSTGMHARLSFATATAVPRPVLVVDEVLAVGDASFQVRCIQRVRAQAAEGAAVLFVSHDLWLVGEVCPRAVWLDAGRVVDDGGSGDLLLRYADVADARRSVGSETVRVHRISVDVEEIAPGDPITGEVEVEVAPGPARRGAVRIGLARVVGPVFASEQLRLPRLPPGRHTVRFACDRLRIEGGEVRVFADGEAGLAPVAEGGATRLRVRGRQTLYRPVLEFDATVQVTPGRATATTPEPRWATVDPATATLLGTALTKSFLHRAHRDRVRRARVPALADVDLDVEPGSCLGIIGPNGAGKSTALRVLSGISGPDSGTVVARGGVAAIIELQGGFVRDEPLVDNLVLAAHLLDDDPVRARAIVDAAVSFADLEDHVDVPARTLSLGMLNRAFLSVVLHGPSRTLLLDEALSVGDRSFRTRVGDRLRTLLADGRGAVLVSHNLELVRSWCDRTVVLEHGRVVARGATADVLGALTGPWRGGTATDPRAPVVVEPLVVDEARHGRVTATGSLRVLAPTPGVTAEVQVRSIVEREHDGPLDASEVASCLVGRQGPMALGDLEPGRHQVRVEVSDLALSEGEIALALVVQGPTPSEGWAEIGLGEGDRVTSRPRVRLGVHLA